MTSHDPKSIFLDRSTAHSHVNGLGPNWEQAFASATKNLKNNEFRQTFKSGFAQAVTGKAVSAREYEIATGWDFDSEDEYRRHLRRLWEIFYPDENPDEYV